MLADIGGFLVRPLTRDPGQVFLVLETLYTKFDDIAKRRRVFQSRNGGRLLRRCIRAT